MDQPVLHEAFLHAFSDYVVPLRLTPEQFADMMTRRGVDMSLSIGAFEQGALIGFNLNAQDMIYGKMTIYDSGTGIAPEFRRRGIAESLFQHSLPYLRERGASQYLLEVFQQNTAAVRLYEKIGFHVVRQLKAFRKAESGSPGRESETSFICREIEPDWAQFQRLWDWSPTWQNSIASIQRSKAVRVTLGVFCDQELVGYGIVFPVSGDIPQFCIRRDQRRKGAATSLFNRLQNFAANVTLRTINIDSSDEAAIRFLETRNFEQIGTQYEMKMDL